MPTVGLAPDRPIVTKRPGRRPGSGYGSRWGSGWGRGSGGNHRGRGNSGFGGGFGYGFRHGFGHGFGHGFDWGQYYYPRFGHHYPWRWHHAWHDYGWGWGWGLWGYYSWPRYTYDDPYWGGFYGGYSRTIYVYRDLASAEDYVDAATDATPVVDLIGSGSGGGRAAGPVEDAPDAGGSETATDSEDLILARHYSSLGDLYLRTRRYSRAWDSYRRAVTLAVEDGSLRFVLADALFQLGKIDECAYQIRKGLALDPGLASVEVDKRSFFDWPEDFDAELAKLEKKVAAEPFQANMRLVLAYNYRMTRRYTEAARELSTLAEQLPGDETIQLMLKALDSLPTPPKGK